MVASQAAKEDQECHCPGDAAARVCTNRIRASVGGGMEEGGGSTPSGAAQAGGRFDVLGIDQLAPFVGRGLLASEQTAQSLQGGDDLT